MPGWASWRQVWPTAAPGPGGSSGFDVSDVDLTNIPDPDCEDIVSGHIRRACHSWQLDTSVGVAGVYDKYVVHVQTDPDTGRADGVWKELVAVYLQLKVSDPDDEEEMQALRDRLHPDTFGPDWEVITIPVKYDFGGVVALECDPGSLRGFRGQYRRYHGCGGHVQYHGAWFQR